jgi:hypothetical protein
MPFDMSGHSIGSDEYMWFCTVSLCQNIFSCSSRNFCQNDSSVRSIGIISDLSSCRSRSFWSDAAKKYQ